MARTTNIKISDQHSILDGEALIYRVPLSGDVYQFRMYLKDEQKHYRKSLRTKDLESALSKGRKLALEVMGKKEAGKKIFGVTLKEMVGEYLVFRDREVAAGIITAGRLVTIKSQLNHFLKIKGAETKASELDDQAVYDWRLMRRERNPEVRDVTVRNETATINALAKWAYKKGYLHFDKFEFETIKISKDAVGRRDTFTLEEYDSLILFMRTYVSKAVCPNAVERNERLLMRDYVLISTNTAMRVGELRQLTWGDLGRFQILTDENGREIDLVEIHIRAETSKVRTPRKIITRGGQYFKRLKSRLTHVRADDRVFAGSEKNGGIPARIWERHWRNLMEGIDLGDYKERNVTWYSLRHFGITVRVRSGADIIDIAKQAGTSVGHIENTYLKYSEDMMIASQMKSFKILKSARVEKDGFLSFDN